MSQLHVNDSNAPFILCPEEFKEEFYIQDLSHKPKMQVLADVNTVLLEIFSAGIKAHYPELNIFIRQTIKGNIACELSLGQNNKVSFITPDIREVYAYVKGAAVAITYPEDILSREGIDSTFISQEYSSIPNLSDTGGILRSLELMKSLFFVGYTDYQKEESCSGTFTLVLSDEGLVGVSDYCSDFHIVWRQNYLTYYYLLGIVNAARLVCGLYEDFPICKTAKAPRVEDL